MTHLLETERLSLRELTPDDLDFVASMLADAETMRYYPRCYSREESLEWIERQQQRYIVDGHALWLVVDRKSDERVGQVGLVKQHVFDRDECEVGYLISRPFWRRGFATEAARACRDYAFTVLARDRVISLIRPENGPSQAVARKLGMTPAGETEHGGFAHLVFSVAKDGV